MQLIERGFNDSIWLMPHQTSVVNSAMIYTPVRSMLCDEVGLGKTIQADKTSSKSWQKTEMFNPEGDVMMMRVESAEVHSVEWAVPFRRRLSRVRSL